MKKTMILKAAASSFELRASSRRATGSKLEARSWKVCEQSLHASTK